MRFRPEHVTTLALVVAAGALSSGCAKTGLAWVKRPEPGAIAPRDARTAAAPEPESAERPVPERPGAPPRRLSKTLSLGESVTTDDRPPAEAPEQPLVIQVAPYRQANYGYFLAPEPIVPDEPIVIDPDPIVVPEPPPQGVQPGRDWPPPPNFGPPFPFRSEPADPFAP